MYEIIVNSLNHTAILLMAPSAPAGQQATAPGWTNMMPLVLMVVVFYFLLIRPQQKRMKETQKMIDSLETGDEVVTSGGILGTITNRKEKTVTVRIAENVKIEVLRSAVQSVTKPDGKTTSVPS